MIWCLGMFSSASTWAFNVAQAIAWTQSPTRAPRSEFLPVDATTLDWDEHHGTLIVKTHGTAIARELATRASGILITIRDPRDAIVSLMRYNGIPFDIALRMTEVSARTCTDAIGHPNAALFRFEDRFFDHPATVARIARLFGADLPGPACQRIFDSLRREAVDAFIARLDDLPTTARFDQPLLGTEDVYDPTTLWHKHHANRDAEIGRWHRDLTEPQIAEIEQRLRPWMTRSGYK